MPGACRRPRGRTARARRFPPSGRAGGRRTRVSCHRDARQARNRGPQRARRPWCLTRSTRDAGRPLGRRLPAKVWWFGRLTADPGGLWSPHRRIRPDCRRTRFTAREAPPGAFLAGRPPASAVPLCQALSRPIAGHGLAVPVHRPGATGRPQPVDATLSPADALAKREASRAAYDVACPYSSVSQEPPPRPAPPFRPGMPGPKVHQPRCSRARRPDVGDLASAPAREAERTSWN